MNKKKEKTKKSKNLNELAKKKKKDELQKNIKERNQDIRIKN